MGKYCNDHERFPGLLYLEVGMNMVDKTNKLSVSRPVFLLSQKARRVVDNPNDPLSIVKLYTMLCERAHPDQKYVHCAEASSKLKNQLTKGGFPNVAMDADKLLGKRKVSAVR